MNAVKQKALEDRLKILNLLETIATQAPDQPYHEFTLADFKLGSATPARMKIELDELYRDNVLVFTVPHGLANWNFWDSIIRVRNIDTNKVHALQKSTREELAEATGSRKSASGDEGNGSSWRRYRVSIAGIVSIISAVLGIVNSIFTWQLPGTDVVRTLLLVGLGVIVAVGARLYPRVKGGEVTKASAVDMVAVGIFVMFATIAVFIAFKPGAASAPPAHPAARPAPSAFPLLRFAPGQASESLQCHEYQGIGSIPAGYQLEIFVSSTETGPYDFAQPASNTPGPGGWQTDRIKVENDPTWIWAILVTQAEGAYIAGIQADIPHEPWLYSSQVLPPSLENIPPIKVSTDLHGSGCAPTS